MMIARVMIVIRFKVSVNSVGPWQKVEKHGCQFILKGHTNNRDRIQFEATHLPFPFH